MYAHKGEIYRSRTDMIEARLSALEASAYRATNVQPASIPGPSPIDSVTSEMIAEMWIKTRAKWRIMPSLIAHPDSRVLYCDRILVGCFPVEECERIVENACGEAVRQLCLRGV